MEICRAGQQDHKGILRLYGEFNEDRIKSGVGDASYRFIEGEVPWAGTLVDPECTTFVAKQRDFVVGFITVRIPQHNPLKNVKKLGEVDLIVVEERVRRRGLGEVLYNAAENYFRSNNVSHVLLNVRVGNEPAMAFWRRHGYREVSETDYSMGDGVEEKTKYMMKKM